MIDVQRFSHDLTTTTVVQAYVYELDDEYAESDIPTTLMRSKADCPTLEVGCESS